VTLATWIAGVLGRYVRADADNLASCVSLVNDYMSQAIDAPHWSGNAVDIAAQHQLGWQWVANGPVNYPAQGDIAVWGLDAGAGTSAWGHCAVVLVADPGRLITLDQNWPHGAPVSVVAHTYAGVRGWQHRR
jgi:hypothetical protein